MIQDGERALMTGFVIGTMITAGLDVRPEVDADGDYLPSIMLTLPDPMQGVKVRLVVELP